MLNVAACRWLPRSLKCQRCSEYRFLTLFYALSWLQLGGCECLTSAHVLNRLAKFNAHRAYAITPVPELVPCASVDNEIEMQLHSLSKVQNN